MLPAPVNHSSTMGILGGGTGTVSSSLGSGMMYILHSAPSTSRKLHQKANTGNVDKHAQLNVSCVSQGLAKANSLRRADAPFQLILLLWCFVLSAEAHEDSTGQW